MAHEHHHHEGEQHAYYLEQIFTIAICGALGGVAIMLYSSNRLWWLVNRFHPWVLAGGCTLLLLVVIRAIAVWRSVDAVDALTVDPGHDHSHDHEHCHDAGCAHEHSHSHEHGAEEASGHVHEHVPVHSHGYDPGHDHGHDHGHEHGWAPWRYVVLLLPILLYFLDLPNEGFSALHAGGLDLNTVPTLNGTVQSTGSLGPEIGFSQLEQMALTAEGRDAYEGKTITLKGLYGGGDAKKFTLVRYKQVCCAADARPLNAVIVIDPKSTERLDPEKYRNKWVQVTGRVHYIDRGNSFLTAVILYPSDKEPLSNLVQVVPADPNPFVN